MIDAQYVYQGEIRLQALQPPGKTVLCHFVPAVQGIPPKLAVLGKGIRRAACHLGGHIVFVQLEQLRPGPHIGAVHCHIDRRVPNDLHALFVGVLFQFAPLLKK